MKELSIEEKAKAYDEAIERAKKYLGDCMLTRQEYVEKVFPELAESEDERIRKEIISMSDTLGRKDWIAWLEKQGEHANFRNKIQIGDKVTRNEDGVLVNLSQLKRVAKPEQKPADVDYNPFDDFRKSDSEINPSEFDARLNALLKEFESLPKEELVNSLAFYLNVIQNDGTYKSDEKQGEQKPNPCENCSIATNNCQKLPCTIRDGEQKFEQKFFINDKVVHKATGKIWTIHHYLKDTNSYYVEDNDGLLHHYRENELKLVEQKPAWSKEDENNILFLTSIIEECFKDKEKITLCGDTVCASFTKENVIDRLKSLRPQSQWKPSREQMEALEHFIVYHNGSTNYAKDLEELRLQLKKLREE